ncbi:hypothetical protein G7046_g405 [Stylonectria norvegica]|nr:hypothetical protein G7046_g405 [Stylonectria norvegica]
MNSLLLTLGACLVAGSPTFPRDAAPVLSLTNITSIGFAHENLHARSMTGPAMGVDFPDPSIISGEGTWKAYSTSAGGKKIQLATSNDALSWTLSTQDALPNPGSWVDPNDQGIWAPDVQKNDNGVYVMYYTAHRNGGNHCIGAATASTAMGPFTPQSAPLICNDAGGGVIDASGYDDGVDRWIVWKVDGSSLGGATSCPSGGAKSSTYITTPIMIQKVARDALTLQGSAKKILDNVGANNDGIVEAPVLYKINSSLFVLFYSAHCYLSDDYDIEYAFSTTIDGTYSNRGLLLRTVDNKGVFGPGGLDLDPNGRNAVFHGRLGANQGSAARELYSAVLTINGNAISM